MSKSKRVGSMMAESYSAYSKHSMKATSSTTSRIPKINQSGRDSKTRGMKRYDVIDKNSSEKMTSDDEKKQQNADKNKLLKNRERKKSKRIVDQELFESVSNIGKQQLITDAGSKHDRVKSPTVNDPRSKTRDKDSPPMEDDMATERPGSLRTSVLRRQWNQSHSGSGSTVPLTPQLLKDFTNSPEGKVIVVTGLSTS